MVEIAGVMATEGVGGIEADRAGCCAHATTADSARPTASWWRSPISATRSSSSSSPRTRSRPSPRSAECSNPPSPPPSPRRPRSDDSAAGAVLQACPGPRFATHTAAVLRMRRRLHRQVGSGDDAEGAASTDAALPSCVATGNGEVTNRSKTASGSSTWEKEPLCSRNLVLSAARAR